MKKMKMIKSDLFSVILIIWIITMPCFCKAEGANSLSKTSSFSKIDVSIGLIDVAQLKKDMELKEDTAKWVILDARPLKYWEKSHIPKSIPFSWDNYTKKDENQIAYRILPPDEIAQALGKLGISDESPIVVYGDADESWGGEGWLCWVFAWLGHKGDIRLLKGGIQAWEKAGCSLISNKDGQIKEKRITKPVEYKLDLTNTSSQFSINTSSINIYSEEIHDNFDKYQLVDTRSNIEWFKGHLPNAIHIPWEEFFQGKDRTPLDSAELKSLLSKNGVIVETGKQNEKLPTNKEINKNSVNVEKPVVYYCTGGIRSGYAWMVHQLAARELKELPKAINFEGGTEEWEKVIEK
ncbi:MAG: hypothetical protein HQK70_09700 [Desulfamplus sp.]|nr:hypothetical protein [Desulfamplus sp.]